MIFSPVLVLIREGRPLVGCYNHRTPNITGVILSVRLLSFLCFDRFPVCGHRRTQFEAIGTAEVLGNILYAGLTASCCARILLILGTVSILNGMVKIPVIYFGG